MAQGTAHHRAKGLFELVVHCPEAHQRIVDGVPDNADGSDDTRVGNADAHDIGQEEQVEQVLEVKHNIAGGGEGGKAQFFQGTYLGGLPGWS